MENKQSRNEYVRRIHTVQDYIESNIDSSLSIEELADVAGFSKFHFHRIFKGIVDEPLSRYVIAFITLRLFARATSKK